MSTAQAAPHGLGSTQIIPPLAQAEPAASAAAPLPGSAGDAAAAPQAARPEMLRTQLQYTAPQDGSAATPVHDTTPQDTLPESGSGPDQPASHRLAKATMLGMPAIAFPHGGELPPGTATPPSIAFPRSAEQPPDATKHKQTLLGLPPASVVPNSTMLGIAPAAQPTGAQAQPPTATQQAPGSGGAPAGPAALPSDKRTMLGVAMPGIAPTGNNAGPVASQKRTMLGVAMPGIAPINPGVAAAPSSTAAPGAPVASHPAAGVPQVSPQPAYTQPTADTGYAPSQPPATKRSLLPWFLVATAVVILAGGVGLWFVLKPSTPISARLQATEDGKERLDLSCLACPDGSKIKLKSEAEGGSFSAGRASLALGSNLDVGDNQLQLELTRPGARPESVELSIPVEYRVNVDLSALDATPPKLALAVAARPGSTVKVEGKPLELDAKGTATWTQDLSDLLVGPAKGVERLERELSYEVTPTGGSAQRGTAKLRIGIAPLIVDAPLSKLTVDKPRFLLSGSTQPDVDVSVSGRPIKRSADGAFAQVMNVSSLGETTVYVKATKEGLAPRLVPLRIKRVERLEQAAAQFTKQELKSYREVTAALGKSAGALVAWTGKVTDLRAADGRTIILLDVSGQCSSPPCLARVVYAGESKPKSSDKISVYGEMTRAVAGPRSGQQVPEIYAEFLIEGAP